MLLLEHDKRERRKEESTGVLYADYNTIRCDRYITVLQHLGLVDSSHLHMLTDRGKGERSWR